MQVPSEMDASEVILRAGMPRTASMPKDMPADLLDHFARDLCMRRQVLGCARGSCCCATLSPNASAHKAAGLPRHVCIAERPAWSPLRRVRRGPTCPVAFCVASLHRQMWPARRNPEAVPAEHGQMRQVRRELLTPVLMLAALCVPGCRVRASDRVTGSLGNGLVDFTVGGPACAVPQPTLSCPAACGCHRCAHAPGMLPCLPSQLPAAPAAGLLDGCSSQVIWSRPESCACR